MHVWYYSSQLKYQRIYNVYMTFFDAQKALAGVPQTGMCGIGREQNALYLNHCGEYYDTEGALHDAMLLRVTQPIHTRKLSSKSTAALQRCFYFLLWSEALGPH